MRTASLFSSALLLIGGMPLLSLPPLASAQEDDDPDSRAYRAYILTVPKFKKHLGALVNLATATQQNPKVKEAYHAALEASISEGVAQFDRVPEARRAIADAGLTTREFVVAQGAFFQAWWADQMAQKGTSPDSALMESGATQAQLEFMAKNRAEIDRLTKEAEAKNPALKQLKRQGEETGAAESE
jgi:hypothetical protein